MVEFKSEESAFNFAVKYLEQISNGLRMCEQYASLGNAEGWIAWLRIVFRELSCKTTSEEDEKFNVKFREINALLNNPSTKIIKRTEILYLLDKLETDIRKMLQKKGMLLPLKDDPRFSVLKR